MIAATYALDVRDGHLLHAKMIREGHYPVLAELITGKAYVVAVPPTLASIAQRALGPGCIETFIDMELFDHLAIFARGQRKRLGMPKLERFQG